MDEKHRKIWDETYKSQGVLWSRTHEKWFETGDNEMILDLGCGSGKSSEHLRGRVVCADFSMKALKIAYEQLPSIMPICCDASDLPFLDSTFDFIRASFILGHLIDSDRRRTLDETSRILKNKGKIAIEVFSTDDGRFGKGKKIESGTFQDGKGIIHHFFEKRELEYLLSSFNIDEIGMIEWEQRIGSKEKMRRSVIRAVARKKKDS